jgi:peptidyl-prolyl cis-trans isomerase C
MKLKYLLTAILAITISTSAFAKDLVVAKYDGGKEVKESDIMKKYADFISQPQFKGKNFIDLDSRIQEALVKNYVTDILITEETKKSDVQNSPAFKEKLAYIMTQLPKEIFLEQIVKKAVSEKEIDEEYNKMIKDLKSKKRIKVSHVLVNEESTAKDVKKKLDQGAKFVEVCEQYSVDPSAKVNVCSLGIINQGQLVAEFEKVAFSMKVGTISEPVKTQFGWHVIKLDDKMDAVIPKKEEVIEAIKENAYKKAFEEYISNLFTKFGVQITLPTQTSSNPKK